jgi:serine O-acetyltransferase
MFDNLRADIQAVKERDPAARSRLEVFLAYPGIHALMFYRQAHRAWNHQWYLLGRVLSHIGRVLTGIEIHPGAKIGQRVFIDHGMGVVIGETAEVGDDCTLYQGVTLGGTSLEKGKRHPTLKNGVIVGGGAKVLGPITIGEHAMIGANAVVVKDVPDGVTVAGVPAKIVRGKRKGHEDEFLAYGTPGDLPDPVARSIDKLLDMVDQLGSRVGQLERELRELKTGREVATQNDQQPKSEDEEETASA